MSGSILGSVASNISAIAGNLGGAESAIQTAQSVKDYATVRAKQIAVREFMYMLRGENEQIKLENLKGLRGADALKLSAMA